MKLKLILAFCFLSLQSFSKNNFWKTYSSIDFNIEGKQTLKPIKNIYAVLDVNSFQSFQHLIPTEEMGNFPIISLPNPKGEMEDFFIYENQTMHPDLASKFKGIKTYTAFSTSNPHKTAKLDFTYFGFHAKVFDAENTYFIDPYNSLSKENYIVYYKKDFIKNLNERMLCENEAENELFPINEIIDFQNHLPELTANKTFGVDKRTYRLALACTIEYSSAVGGATPTKGSVLAAMVTTMNRVNGVFEKDFSMTTQLIGNNDTLIYLPSGSDPYTNNNGSTMLGQNQTNLTTLIGSANYDFGHVFSTGGGGIASLGSVCNNSRKAQGVTGSSNPIGDPFDIDYVAHEMGHQFGGSHTFNSTQGSCGGNGSSSSAYEIGSGTTIQAYAGICGSDNIQPHSDDYYHRRSLNQMSKYIEGGGNCAIKVASGNNMPILTNIVKTYNIPYRTSFELEAQATDSDNDPMTFCWEQYDRGTFGDWDATPNTTAPLFRSFNPVATNWRTFPAYAKLITNTESYLGEVLPKETRNMSFRMTVRDIRNGWGTFNYSDSSLEVEVVNTGVELFRVTSQNTASQSFNAKSMQNVTWTVAGTNTGQVNTPNVDIYFSADSGRTFPFLLLANTPNDGSETVQLPDLNTTGGRLKVKGAGNIFFDLNDNWITLVNATGINGISKSENYFKIFPNPSEGIFNLETIGNVKIRSLKITDVLGKVIFEKLNFKDEKIDLSMQSAGIYYINVKTFENGQYFQKIIVK